MSARCFHVAPAGDWSAFERSSEDAYAPPSLAREGFVHLSRVDQLRGTLALHFAGIDEVRLVELDPARLGGDLVDEPSRDGRTFPHLYRALRRDDVLATWLLERRDGELVPPPELGQRS